ncbi:MAG: hypothetical protein ACO24H_03235 [Polynucleobacter sp.]
MGFPVIPTTAVVAQVTYVDPGYVVIYDAVAEVHVVEAGYLAEYQNLTIKAASVIFPTRFAADVINPLDGTVLSTTKVLDDTPILQEFVGIDFAKPLVDSVSIVDQVDIAYDIGKVFDEFVTFVEGIVVVSGKGLVDIVVPVDSTAFVTNKVLADTPVLQEFIGISFSRPVSDSFSMIDQADIAYNIGKIFTDAYLLTDTATVTSGKGITDIVSMVDNMDGDIEFGLIKSISELQFVTESLVRAVGKPITDTFTGIDQPSLGISRPVADSISFVDFVTITKTLAIYKADIIALQEVFDLAVSKGISDSFAGVDTTAYSFAKVLDDISTISDQTAIDSSLQKVDNAVLNDVGFVVIQDYCDITYFLEDYVGQSSHFT